MATQMIVVRDEPEPYVTCPNCQVRLELPEVAGEKWIVRAPSDIAYRLQIHMASLEREELRVALLNAKNRVMAIHTVYQGNVSASLVRVGELFREAVRTTAAGLILVHNHPSGDPTPLCTLRGGIGIGKWKRGTPSVASVGSLHGTPTA